jgi:hypothetical protein
MAMDMSVDLIGATVELEQPLGAGLRTVGTGFLVSDPGPDGTPRVILVTANHVFEKMKGAKATVGFRVEQPDGSWRFAPEKIVIRKGGKELWAHHAVRDVAAIQIVAPPAFAKAAIPLAWLAGNDAMTRYRLEPGDEMMTLGFPQGLSANSAGFPILRAGKVASYPLGPSNAFPTFLLDFHVFPGNSGGPVFLETHTGAVPGAEQPPAHLIAGMLTQEVEVGDENLGIGIVTQARFVRETLAMLDAPVPATHLAATGVAGTPAVAVSRVPTDKRDATAASSDGANK